MPAIINFKICDNCDACNAINVCPTKAFRWNDKKKTLEIDNEKCIECGLCATSEESCQVGAIKFSKSPEEFEKIKDEIEKDERTIADLMVDRYGAQPINMPFYCEEDELDKVINTDKTCFIEVFNDDSIDCLIKSIPIKEIFKELNKDILYRKLEVKTEEFKQKYSIKELPSIIFFKDKKCLGIVEGYYSTENKQELLDKIKEILE